jgi:glutathione S-transferase
MSLRCDNRQGWFLAKNPSGQLPALELDDGRMERDEKWHEEALS